MTSLEVLEHVGKLGRGGRRVQREYPVDDVVRSRFIRRIQVARLGSRLEWTNHDTGGVGTAGIAPVGSRTWRGTKVLSVCGWRGGHVGVQRSKRGWPELIAASPVKLTDFREREQIRDRRLSSAVLVRAIEGEGHRSSCRFRYRRAKSRDRCFPETTQTPAGRLSSISDQSPRATLRSTQQSSRWPPAVAGRTHAAGSANRRNSASLQGEKGLPAWFASSSASAAISGRLRHRTAYS